MLLCVVGEYNGIGDYRVLDCGEIEFFYNGKRKAIAEATKPKAK